MSFSCIDFVPLFTLKDIPVQQHFGSVRGHMKKLVHNR